MAELEELLIQLKADNEEFKAALKSSQSDLNKATDAMTKAVDGFSKKSENGFKIADLALGSFVGSLASNAVTGAIGSLTSAFSALFSESIGGAAEAQQNAALLANAFALAGQEGSTSAQSFGEFADKISEVTAFEDDAIVKTGALIETMARLDSDGLQRATKAAIDFAAATGKDLPEVTRAVAMAAEGNLAALSKLGIKLDDTGSKTKNAELALSVLEARFGGSAARAVNTFTGAMTQAGNNFGNLSESLGNVIVQNPAVIAGIKEISKIFVEMKNSVTESNGELSVYATTIAKTIVDSVGLFASAMDVLANLTQKVVGSFLVFGDAVDFAFTTLQDKLQGTDEAGAVFDRMQQNMEFLNKSDEPGVFGAIAEGAARIGNAMDDAFDGSKIDGTNVALGVTKDKLSDANGELTRFQEASKSFGESLLKKGEDPSAKFTQEQEALKASFDAKLITEQEYLQQKTEILRAQHELENQMLLEAQNTSLENETKFREAEGQLRAKQHAEDLRLLAEKTKAEEARHKASLQGYSTFFGGLSALTESSNKELAAIGKAAAISKATIDAYLAIQNALANVPYPANIAAAFGIGVQAFANVAKISGVGFAAGIDKVPGQGNRDSFPAMLTPGERVVPKNTNQDLKEFLDNQEGGGTVVNNTFNISGLIPSDGEAIIRVINDAVARGSLRILPT